MGSENHYAGKLTRYVVTDQRIGVRFEAGAVDTYRIATVTGIMGDTVSARAVNGADLTIDANTWMDDKAGAVVVYCGGHLDRKWSAAKAMDRMLREVEYGPLGNPMPLDKTKRALLNAMLQGEEPNLIDAARDLALQTLPARIAELRRLGWPIRSLEKPHPTMPGATLTHYQITRHFRDWYVENNKAHPGLYPGEEGRLNPYSR